jgi:hypothetical protein
MGGEERGVDIVLLLLSISSLLRYPPLPSSSLPYLYPLSTLFSAYKAGVRTRSRKDGGGDGEGGMYCVPLLFSPPTTTSIDTPFTFLPFSAGVAVGGDERIREGPVVYYEEYDGGHFRCER